MHKKLSCGLILVFLFAFTFTVAYSYVPYKDAQEDDCCRGLDFWTHQYYWGVWHEIDGDFECMCDEVNNPNECTIFCSFMMQ